MIAAAGIVSFRIRILAMCFLLDSDEACLRQPARCDLPLRVVADAAIRADEIAPPLALVSFISCHLSHATAVTPNAPPLSSLYVPPWPTDGWTP